MTHDINIHHEDNHESASSYLVGEIKDLFVKSNKEDKFLNQLISIGPDVTYQAKEFNAE